jgi:acyl-CoA dehydrogenase
MSLALLGCLAVLLVLLAAGRAALAWIASGALFLAAWRVAWGATPAWWAACALGAVLLLLLGVPAVRRALLTPAIMRSVGGMLPRMGDTERIALEAGTVWWDGELFSGRPRWDAMLAFRPRELTERERGFLDGPCEDLCRRLDDWQVVQTGDLPPDIWELLKRERFLGLIIPEAWGGLGFSAAAHAAVITKLSSHCVTAAVTVMVPNSLGPAELLLHYGTDAQKAHWLPRLARGEEIPCFALTGPENGSDAAAMRATGTVCHGIVDGREVLGLRLSWDKRYTTLSPVATVIGLAFRLLDPDGLLGPRTGTGGSTGGSTGAGGTGRGAAGEDDGGITLALVPAQLPGIVIGERHDPLGVPFLNGPHRGSHVFVPIDAIIGGPAMAGQGWRMLMDCLAAGRSISLPSLSAGCTQLVTRLTGAYASVRRQFGLPIGRFEGIEERLARIGGLTWMVGAARTLTAGAVDAGEKPAVLSAICKAWCTESMRVVVNDGMDVLGGAGISRGPRNVLARAYQAAPIGITVEGANILTRSLIVFGQGALRCHPYAHAEIEAVAARDRSAFDRAFFGHVGFVACTAARALLLGLRGRGGGPATAGAGGPALTPESRALLGRVERLSADFALCSDVAMATLGGALKRREMLSGRLADALAWLYLATASVHRLVAAGEPEEERAAARWAAEHALERCQLALVGVLDNLPSRSAALLLRVLCFPLGTRVRGPSDALSAQVARGLLDGGALRERLTRDIHVPADPRSAVGRLERALERAVAAAPVERKLKEALREGRLAEQPAGDLGARAVAAGVLTDAESSALLEADRARTDAVLVDAFDATAFAALRG